MEMLQIRFEQVVQDNEEKDKQIQAFESENGEAQADYLKVVQSRLAEAETLIEGQESQIEDNRVRRERDDRELAALRPMAKRFEELQDQVKELQVNNESLAKKANKADHFQKKLERYNILEKEVQRLREYIQTADANLVDYDQTKRRNEALKAENTQYRITFEQYEREAHEGEQTLRFLKDKLRQKDIELEAQVAQRGHDEEFISQLQEQIRTTTNTDTRSPDSPAARTKGLSLEDELQESDDYTTNYVLEISRLKAENQLMKSNTAGTNNATLRADLEDAERLRKRLEAQIQDLTEKYAIGQEHLTALLSNVSGEKLVKILDHLINIGPIRILTEGFYRNEAISSTRKLWLVATKELAIARSKIEDLQADVTDRDRQILAAKADCESIALLAERGCANTGQ